MILLALVVCIPLTQLPPTTAQGLRPCSFANGERGALMIQADPPVTPTPTSPGSLQLVLNFESP